MIIGLVGLAGSGKDTVGGFLVQDHDFMRIALADPLKRFAREVYDFSEEQLWGPSQFRNAPDLRYPRIVRRSIERDPGDTRSGFEEITEYLTPRYALQTLGTEWGRDCYDNTWIDLAIRSAKKVLGGGFWYDERSGVYECSRMNRPPAGVVITDCRFLNEERAIKAAGGKVIRIVRPGAGLVGAAGKHKSETEQLQIRADVEIVNAGTLDELRANVRGLVESILSA